jgi:hypothetical protein
LSSESANAFEARRGILLAVAEHDAFLSLVKVLDLSLEYTNTYDTGASKF